MKDKLIKLIDLKSIITILLIGVFCFLTVKGDISSDEFIPIVTMILTFYFVKKSDES